MYQFIDFFSEGQKYNITITIHNKTQHVYITLGFYNLNYSNGVIFQVYHIR
jgi:hypothetical protein